MCPRSVEKCCVQVREEDAPLFRDILVGHIGGAVLQDHPLLLVHLPGGEDLEAVILRFGWHEGGDHGETVVSVGEI